MEEFCLEEDFLRFLNELPEDLFDQNEEKVIMSSFDIFKAECLGMTPATPEPNLRFPVQVEDSNFYHVAAQELSGEQSALPQFITNSSNYRESKRLILDVALNLNFVNIAILCIIKKTILAV